MVVDNSRAAVENSRNGTMPVDAALAQGSQAGWSEARVKAWANRDTDDTDKMNVCHYRFNAPGEAQCRGKWTSTEHNLFMATLAKCPDGRA